MSAAHWPLVHVFVQQELPSVQVAPMSLHAVAPQVPLVHTFWQHSVPSVQDCPADLQKVPDVHRPLLHVPLQQGWAVSHGKPAWTQSVPKPPPMLLPPSPPELPPVPASLVGEGPPH